MEDQGDIENEGGGIGVMIMENGKDLERNISAVSESGVRQPLLSSKSRVNNTSQIAIIGANVCPIESLDYEYGSAFLSANWLFSPSLNSYGVGFCPLILQSFLHVASFFIYYFSQVKDK